MVLKMTLETASTKDLLYADYRYEHCDEIRKELNLRGE